MDKNFVVTGAARGIGEQISRYRILFLQLTVYDTFVRRILSRGGRVVFTDIDSEAGEETHRRFVTEFGEKKAEFIVQDVTDKDQWRQVWARAEAFFGGPVEALVNNAGIFDRNVDVNSAGVSTDLKVVETNLMGTIYGTTLALEKMSVGGGGAGGLLVQICSIAALLNIQASSLYTASKAGVLGYVRSHGPLREKVTGVRMVAVCPGLTDTSLARKALNISEGVLKSTDEIAMSTEKVADAVERTVLSGQSGSALLVQSSSSFYWPELSQQTLTVYRLLARLDTLEGQKCLLAVLILVLTLVFTFYLQF